MNGFGKLFENGIWQSRLIVLLAVVASILSAIGLVFMATVDAFNMLAHLTHYASPELDETGRALLRRLTVTHVVEIVDGYLLATFLLIFGMGLYELFINKIGYT